MTIKNAFDQYVKSLSTVYDEGEAESIAKLIFEERVGLKSSDIILHGEETMNEVKANDLAWKLLRLMKGEPVQYVLGYSYFCDLKLKVNKSVLIPRPETEELAEWVISENQNKSDLKVLDIGTGSGCIAIALKKNLPHSKVYALDISEEALKVADENAEANGIEISFIHADILAPQFALTYSPFSTIVSNPPYVPESEKNSIHKNVLNYEPHAAFFVPENAPLIFYKGIIQFASEHLQKDGDLYFEINPSKAQEIKQQFEASGFRKFAIKNDLSGKERMVKATK